MKVSIVITCFNNAPHLADCLDALLLQTYDQLEVVCVDDGSTDDTLKILNQYQKKSKFPFYIILQNAKGPAKLKNEAVAYCSGDYIQFVEVEERLTPTKISSQVNRLKKEYYPDLIAGVHVPIVDVSNKEVKYESAWYKLMKGELKHSAANLYKASVLKNGVFWRYEVGVDIAYLFLFDFLKVSFNVVYDDPKLLLTNFQWNSLMLKPALLGEALGKETVLKAKTIAYLKRWSPMALDQEMYMDLFWSIRSLYPYNNSLALEFYQRFLSSYVKPKYLMGTGWMYKLSFGLLGFEKTERIRNVMAFLK